MPRAAYRSGSLARLPSTQIDANDRVRRSHDALAVGGHPQLASVQGGMRVNPRELRETRPSLRAAWVCCPGCAGRIMAYLLGAGEVPLSVGSPTPQAPPSGAARSMTGYTQDTITRPGPHGWPYWQCVGYDHQAGSPAALTRLADTIRDLLR